MNLEEFFGNLDLAQINGFIAEKREEDLHLEFKTANFPNADGLDADRKYFSKCLSGFANSDGGIIVWGIEAKRNSTGNDVASGKKPIPELTKFSNFLQRHEGGAVTATIVGIEYRKVEISGDKGYLLVYVPKSDKVPHMANWADKHYYKRSGDSFYICEHFDIVDMLSRKYSPRLKFELSSFVIQPSNQIGGIGHPKRYDLSAKIIVRNESSVIAKLPMLEIELNHPFQIHQYGLTGTQETGLSKKMFSSIHARYYGGQDIVIYPESNLEVDKIYQPNFFEESHIETLTISYTLVCENMKAIKDRYTIDKSQLIHLFRTTQ